MSTKKNLKFTKNFLNWFYLNHYRNLSLNKSLKTIFIFTIFNIVYYSQSHSQTPFSEFIAPSLKTVQLHRLGWPLSYPIVRLNSDQQLLLSFDELGTGSKNYHYTITLCDVDWSEAQIMTTEYIRGNPINPLLNYSYSFNTAFDFIHYQLTIPNESVKITRSGNYVIKIFEDYNKENPVLVKKFMVVEQQTSIKARIKNTAQSSIRASHQEVNFEVTHPAFTINNPMEEVVAVIQQNGRTDNKIENLKPQFFRNGFMDFNYNRETLMEGGNEFRYFDIRSTRFYSDRVKEIKFMDPFFHAELFPDGPRNPSSYYFHQDINGRFIVGVQERDNPNLEADYVFVHFLLKTSRPQPSQKIYLNGAITNWQLNAASEMKYNPQTHAYELSLLLKQGYYNYQYLAVESGEKQGSLLPMENNFQQTENDYLILIYFKGINDRAHRLIGAETINTMTQQQ